METASPDADVLRNRLLLGRAAPVTVQGGCMAPALRPGQTVLVHRLREPRPGDIALIEAGGVLELHRLLDRVRAGRRTWFVHAGDDSSACGVAGGRDILGIAAVPARPRPSLRARLLGLLLRARALLVLLTR